MSATERPCPGCGADRGAQVCCDACWDRVPAKLPIGQDGSLMTWRRRIPQARITRDWGRVEELLNAVRAWLSEHRI